MGLDMYLYTYVSLFNAEGLPIKINIDGIPLEINQGDSIRKELCYWRKANAIHRWFVDNCADGDDNCEEMFVSKEKLKELLDICEVVLDNRNEAKDLLPTGSGFFFGSLEYDDYYFDDIEKTVKCLKEILNNPLINYVYYQASW